MVLSQLRVLLLCTDTGVQAAVSTHSAQAKRIVLEAFKLTLAEHCHAASQAPGASGSTSACSAELPEFDELASMKLCDLASAVSGFSLDLQDGRCGVCGGCCNTVLQSAAMTRPWPTLALLECHATQKMQGLHTHCTQVRFHCRFDISLLEITHM